jgi:hypothetical protein
MLRRIFGSKREGVVGGWRRLHNEELRNLYTLSNIIRVIKSRRKRWAGHVTCMGEMRKALKTLVGKSEGKRLLGRAGHRWEDNFRTNLREIGGKVQTGFIWFRIGISGRLYGHGNEPLDSIKGGEFLD